MSENVIGNADLYLLREVCRTREIDVKSICDGRVLALARGGIRVHVYGWDFGVNDAPAMLICRNKATCSSILRDGGIPSVPHEVFYRPDRAAFGFAYHLNNAQAHFNLGHVW